MPYPVLPELRIQLSLTVGEQRLDLRIRVLPDGMHLLAAVLAVTAVFIAQRSHALLTVDQDRFDR